MCSLRENCRESIKYHSEQNFSHNGRSFYRCSNLLQTTSKFTLICTKVGERLNQVSSSTRSLGSGFTIVTSLSIRSLATLGQSHRGKDLGPALSPRNQTNWPVPFCTTACTSFAFISDASCHVTFFLMLSPPTPATHIHTRSLPPQSSSPHYQSPPNQIHNQSTQVRVTSQLSAFQNSHVRFIQLTAGESGPGRRRTQPVSQSQSQFSSE